MGLIQIWFRCARIPFGVGRSASALLGASIVFQCSYLHSRNVMSFVCCDQFGLAALGFVGNPGSHLSVAASPLASHSPTHAQTYGF